MRSQSLVHIFLISFPGQGNINPLLRLGKRLASNGLLVTFTAPEQTGKQLRKVGNNISDESTPIGDGFIRFEFFEDGWEDEDPRRDDPDQYLPQLEKVGKQVIPQLIAKNAQHNRPVSCLINNIFIPWVFDVAHVLGLPCALLWVQSCASFAAYYHYYHGLIPFPTQTHPKIDVQLPCMPLLKHDQIPTLLLSESRYPSMRRAILDQYKNLRKPFCILLDTFQELEFEIIDYMSKLCPIKTVGPLYKDQNITIRGDVMKADLDCIEWLDSKPPSSVVYISFGSIIVLKQEQVDEIAHGLLNSGLSFLWVIRSPHNHLPEGFWEKVGDNGKVVQWSPQENVLAHPSIACFVTHCGWNSTMESLSSGIPVIAFPQFGDQVMNAVYLIDVFKTGVRMSRGMAENRTIPREEVEKCLSEATSGAKAANIKQNALKWKAAAQAALAEDGSTRRNLQTFVDEVRRRTAELVDGLVNKSTANWKE
ncbi:hypothetical protein SLEP1_g32727 [Rubroshorea leprosula]|uniref:Glycosyltransferase n=1 Tax=Rubroshorea leprosula TaxID=152421 RepID=A0AAV5KEA0_9ROSI|nr:hypothetical protein SLEP1_g32727 [Rubroshorea leprosula]